MATNYNDFANQTRSEKIVLCHVEPSERFLIWALDTGSQYKRSVDNFVIGISEGESALTEGALPLNSGEWYFDHIDNVVYMRSSDDTNPNTRDILGTYRLFFSNSPLHLPYDLDSGVEVNYEGRLRSNSAIVKELDDEQIGIALESSTTVAFENNDGYFDNYYDVYFFENKRVKVWSWSRDLPISEKRILFDGEVQDKNYSPSVVKLQCKDFMYRLRERLKLDNFSLSDGSISDSIIGTPKRRIYGQVDNVRCVPIDNILDGFSLTGSVSGDLSGTVLTGSGTLFLDEVSPNDSLTITFATTTIILGVESVESDTSLTISDVLEFGFSGESVVNLPDKPWRKRNRSWHITGHRLREPTTTVTSATQPNRLTLADGSDIFDGDLIDVGGFDVNIKRIVGNDVVLSQNIPTGTPSPGTAVIKNPVSKAYVGTKESFINRDWTVSNTTEAIINFNDLTEFNIAQSRQLPGSLTFSNGSRTVSITGADMLNQIEIRDWIKSDDLSHAVWYEVLNVEESVITLRTTYTGANNTGSGFKKNIELIGDNSLITLDCIGLEDSGVWIKTASDAVKHLLESDAGVTTLDVASFSEADADAPYKLAMVIPKEIQGSTPIVRDVVTEINKSVFGSLVNNSDFEIVFNVLTPEKPEDLVQINQDEIIGEPMARSKNEIIRKVNLSYSPFTDRFKDEDSFKTIEYVNEFVDKYIGNRQEFDVVVFLYDDNDAQTIAERYGLYNSLSQSTVTVKAKLNLSIKNLNDKMFVSFDRLYKRFGGRDRRKIGIISKISKDGTNSSVEFNDLGNIFNRVMSVAPDSANEFTSASETEKIFNAYICDNDLEVPDITSDKELGSQIIG